MLFYMNCPICKEVVPFSLQMHMHAVHGPHGPMVDTQPPGAETSTVHNIKKKKQWGRGRPRARSGKAPGAKRR